MKFNLKVILNTIISFFMVIIFINVRSLNPEILWPVNVLKILCAFVVIVLTYDTYSKYKEAKQK